jgi:hypothetical protein
MQQGNIFSQNRTERFLPPRQNQANKSNPTDRLRPTDDFLSVGLNLSVGGAFF